MEGDGRGFAPGPGGRAFQVGERVVEAHAWLERFRSAPHGGRGGEGDEVGGCTGEEVEEEGPDGEGVGAVFVDGCDPDWGACREGGGGGEDESHGGGAVVVQLNNVGGVWGNLAGLGDLEGTDDLQGVVRHGGDFGAGGDIVRMLCAGVEHDAAWAGEEGDKGGEKK